MLTPNKIKHMVQVAHETRVNMERALPIDDPERDKKIDAAFIMGLLHDIGYDKLGENDNISEHPKISAEMVTHFMEYADEAILAIRNHGHDDCTSPFAYALNKADLTVDSHGNYVTMKDRIARIEERYPQTDHAASARAQYENVMAAESRLQKEKQNWPATRKAVSFDTFSSNCPFLYCYKNGEINNGYNCSHPNQTVTETISYNKLVGRCHGFCCPLGTIAEPQDINPDADDQDAIHEKIDWSEITDSPLPNPEDLENEDILLVPVDNNKDSDEAEALFWYDDYLHRFDSVWREEHQAEKEFYCNRKNNKNIPE